MTIATAAAVLLIVTLLWFNTTVAVLSARFKSTTPMAADQPSAPRS